jgi:hypothetical protein
VRTYPCATTVLAAALALFSCGAVQENLLRPAAEAPIDTTDSYLSRGGGPQTGVDIGRGEEHLLTRFQTVLEEKAALEKRERELEDELDKLRTSLKTEQSDHEKETRLRAGAEAESERLRHTKSDRELKILHLQLQVADLQRTKLQLEIATIERQIETLRGQAAESAPPPEGHR